MESFFSIPNFVMFKWKYSCPSDTFKAHDRNSRNKLAACSRKKIWNECKKKCWFFWLKVVSIFLIASSSCSKVFGIFIDIKTKMLKNPIFVVFFCFERNSIYFNLCFEKLRVNFVQNQSKIFENLYLHSAPSLLLTSDLFDLNKVETI